MEIKSTLTNSAGEVLGVTYRDVEDQHELEGKKIQGVHAYCFCKDKLVIVFAPDKWYWTPAGGGMEAGESVGDTVIREVQEETNMRVIQQRLIGVQDIFEPTRTVSQTRSVCIVEPYGDFVSDPDGDITEIKLIDPKDYKKYFDWGLIGDHIMERALELKAMMDLEVKN